MQNRNRLQAHRAPDDHGSGPLIDHYPGPWKDLHLDCLHLVQQRCHIFSRNRRNLNPAAVHGVRPRSAQGAVDGGSHALRGVEIRIVQLHADNVHLRQVERHRPLHQRAPGNPRGGGMIQLFAAPARSRHVAAQHQRPLRLCVNLSIRSVERGHQENAALKRPRISG